MLIENCHAGALNGAKMKHLLHGVAQLKHFSQNAASILHTHAHHGMQHAY